MLVTLPGRLEAASGRELTCSPDRLPTPRSCSQRRLASPKSVASPPAADAVAGARPPGAQPVPQLPRAGAGRRPRSPTSLDRIHIVAASGVQAEIDEIARRVKRLLVDGVAPGDIVVAFRSTPRRGRPRPPGVRRLRHSHGARRHAPAGRHAAGAQPDERAAARRPRTGRTAGCCSVAGDRSLRLFDDRSRRRPSGDRAVRAPCATAQRPRRRCSSKSNAGPRRRRRRTPSRPPPTADARRDGARRAGGAARRAAQARASIERWIAVLGAAGRTRSGLLRPATGDTAGNWSILDRRSARRRAARRLDRLGRRRAVARRVRRARRGDRRAGARRRRAATRPAASACCPPSAARFTRPRHLFVGGPERAGVPRRAPRGGRRRRRRRRRRRPLGRDAAVLPTGDAAHRDAHAQLPGARRAGAAAAGEPVSGRAGARVRRRRVAAHRAAARRRPARRRGRATPPLSRSGAAPRRAVGAGALDRRARVCSPRLSCPRDEADRRRRPVDSRRHRGRRRPRPPRRVRRLRGRARLRRRRGRGCANAFGADHLWSPSQLETLRRAARSCSSASSCSSCSPTPELALAERRGAAAAACCTKRSPGCTRELRGAAGATPTQLAAVLAEQFHDALAAVAAGAARPRARRGAARNRAAPDRRLGRGLRPAGRRLPRRRGARSITPPAAGLLRGPLRPGSRAQRVDAPTRRCRPTSRSSSPRPIDGVEERVQFAGQIDRIDVGRVGEPHGVQRHRLQDRASGRGQGGGNPRRPAASTAALRDGGRGAAAGRRAGARRCRPATGASGARASRAAGAVAAGRWRSTKCATAPLAAGARLGATRATSSSPASARSSPASAAGSFPCSTTTSNCTQLLRAPHDLPHRPRPQPGKTVAAADAQRKSYADERGLADCRGSWNELELLRIRVNPLDPRSSASHSEPTATACQPPHRR